MEKIRKFEFIDEEGIIEPVVYFARPNDGIIPFLKKQGYEEVEYNEVAPVEVAADEEVKIDF